MSEYRDPETARDKAYQIAKVLLSFILAGLATWVVWRFGEAMAIRKFGSGVPWWIYALLFIRPVFSMIQVLGDWPATRQPAPERAFSASVLHQPTTHL